MVSLPNFQSCVFLNQKSTLLWPFATTPTFPRLITVIYPKIAINKPIGISSAQAIRDLQRIFNKSPIFAETLTQELNKRAQESRNQKGRRRTKRGPAEVKMGHGGTLDPMASMTHPPCDSHSWTQTNPPHPQLACLSPVFSVVPRCCSSSSAARKRMSALRSLAAAPIHTML